MDWAIEELRSVAYRKATAQDHALPRRPVLFLRHGILFTAQRRPGPSLGWHSTLPLPQPLFGHGILETMAVKRNRINIEVTPSTGPETDRNDPSRKDTALMSLARLLGRQIAREQFDRKVAAEHKAQHQLRS